MKKTIQIPTLVLAKIKKSKSPKFFYVYDDYDIEVSVVEKTDNVLLYERNADRYNVENVSQYDGKVIASIIDFPEIKSEWELFIKNLFLGTKNFIFPSVVDGKKVFLPLQNGTCLLRVRSNNCLSPDDLKESNFLNEIIYDEKEEIKKGLNIIEKDIFYCNGKFYLKNMFLFGNKTLSRYSGGHFSDDIKIIDKEIPDYFYLGLQTYFVKRFFELVFGGGSLDLKSQLPEFGEHISLGSGINLKNMAINKIFLETRTGMMELVNKYFANNPVVQNSDLNISEIIRCFRFLDQNFVDDVFDFAEKLNYKPNTRQFLQEQKELRNNQQFKI